MLETHFNFCVTELDFFIKNSSPKTQMYQKYAFLNLLKNLVVNFFWIWPTMKVYICYVITQSPYLGKVCFLRYGQNALGQSDCRVFKSTISLEQMNEISRFLCADTNSWILKVDMVKNRPGHSGRRSLKLVVSKMNRWNKLISWIVIQIQGS